MVLPKFRGLGKFFDLGKKNFPKVPHVSFKNSSEINNSSLGKKISAEIFLFDDFPWEKKKLGKNLGKISLGNFFFHKLFGNFFSQGQFPGNLGKKIPKIFQKSWNFLGNFLKFPRFETKSQKLGNFHKNLENFPSFWKNFQAFPGSWKYLLLLPWLNGC